MENNNEDKNSYLEKAEMALKDFNSDDSKIDVSILEKDALKILLQAFIHAYIKTLMEARGFYEKSIELKKEWEKTPEEAKEEILKMRNDPNFYRGRKMPDDVAKGATRYQAYLNTATNLQTAIDRTNENRKDIKTLRAIIEDLDNLLKKYPMQEVKVKV